MSKKIVCRAIDKFGELIHGKQFKEDPVVVFYGGEPLLNWGTFVYALEHIESQQKKGILPKAFDKVLITNGILVDLEKAKILKEHDVMVSVSIDGPEKIHNSNRIYRNQTGSFQNTLRGFNNLKKVGISPTISCVLGIKSIDSIPEIIRFFVEELKVKAFGMNHISATPGVNTYDVEYEKRVADATIQAQEIILKKYPKVYERRMNRKLNNFLDREILPASCTGCGEQMCVSPDGKIGICQGDMGGRETFRNSVFDKNYNPNECSIFKEWSSRSPLTISECWECPALATCGGGCPRNAANIHGSIWDIDSGFCYLSRKAQEWMIWKKYEAGVHDKK